MNQLLALMGSLILLLPGAKLGNDFKVIDGDTLELAQDSQKVRILGINTPERGERCYEESKEELGYLLNESVELKRDISNRDKYGRLLRHLFFGRKLLQEKMVEGGHAKVMCVWPNQMYCEQLMKLELSAVNEGRGCLFKKSNNTCLKITDVDCGGSWFKIQNTCKIEFVNILAENRGRDKVKISLKPFENKTVHIRLFKKDAIYLFDDFGLIDFEPCSP